MRKYLFMMVCGIMACSAVSVQRNVLTVEECHARVADTGDERQAAVIHGMCAYSKMHTSCASGHLHWYLADDDRNAFVCPFRMYSGERAA